VVKLAMMVSAQNEDIVQTIWAMLTERMNMVCFKVIMIITFSKCKVANLTTRTAFCTCSLF